MTLALDVTRFPDAAVLAAAADRATATTLVTPEGRSLTEVSLVAQPGAAVPARRAASRSDAALGGSRRRRGQAGAGRGRPAYSPQLRPGFRPHGPAAVSFVYLHAGPAFAEKGDASLSLARVDLPVAWLEWEMLLPDRMEASRFEGTAFPRASWCRWRRRWAPASPNRCAITADKVGAADGRQRGNELSQNVQDLQKARRRRPAGSPRRPARRPVSHLRPSAGDGRGDPGVLPGKRRRE